MNSIASWYGARTLYKHHVEDDPSLGVEERVVLIKALDTVFAGSSVFLASRLRELPVRLEGPSGPRLSVLQGPLAEFARLEQHKGFSGVAAFGGLFSVLVLLVQGMVHGISWLVVECVIPLVGWALGGPFVAFGSRCSVVAVRILGVWGATTAWLIASLVPSFVVGGILVMT